MERNFIPDPSKDLTSDKVLEKEWFRIQRASE